MANLSDYIVKFNSVDTLASVTARGSTTSSNITVGNLTSTGIDDNATSTALTVTDSGIAATLTTASQPNITSVGTLSGFSSTGIDDNATSTAITIDASENVGIGTTSPTAYANQTNLNINSSGVSRIDFDISDSLQGYALAESGYVGLFANTGNYLALGANNAEHMRIDSSGNVGINSTTPSSIGFGTGATKLFVSAPNSNFGSAISAVADSAGRGLQIATQAKTTTAGIDLTSSVSTFYSTTELGLYASGAERMRIDSSGNVGIGLTPNTWSTGKAVELGFEGNALWGNAADEVIVSQNAYYNSGWKYATTRAASHYSQYNSAHRWFTAASGTADTALTWTQAMTLDANGNLGIGVTNPLNSLHINTGVSSRVTTTNGTQELYSGVWASQPRIEAVNGTLALTSAGGYDITFGTNGAERMRINSSGLVGVNTSNPEGMLHVNSPYSSATMFQRTNNKITFEMSSLASGGYGFYDTVAAQYDAYFKNGNVGIGTTSPGARLDLVGPSSTPLVLEINSANSNCDITMQSANTSSATRLRNGTNDLQVHTNGTERMRIDSSGRLLVGKSSTTFRDDGCVFGASNVDVNGWSAWMAATPGAGGGVLAMNRDDSDGEHIRFHRDGAGFASIGNDSVNLYIAFNTATGIGLASSASPVCIFPTDGSGAVKDNAIDLGYSSGRFDDIYATNGTIQTSDVNEKQDIETLSEAEQRVAVACKGLLRKFRWKSAVEEKGDDARIHFGIIAQDLQAAFEAEGLDAGDYAMFIHSTWTDEETGEERSRMGVRYSELLAFIIAAI